MPSLLSWRALALTILLLFGILATTHAHSRTNAVQYRRWLSNRGIQSLPLRDIDYVGRDIIGKRDEEEEEEEESPGKLRRHI
jgi:hypothetical protein